MSPEASGLVNLYQAYIACLNRQAWDELGKYVHENVIHNEQQLGVSGYRAMLEADFAAIPDLYFAIGLLVANETHVAARLDFDCTPVSNIFNLPVAGTRLRFSENVFYEYEGAKIKRVHSIIDKAAISAQIK